MSIVSGCDERGPSIFACRLDVRAMIKEHPHGVYVPIRGRIHQSGTLALVPSIHRRFSRQLLFQSLHVALTSCVHQLRPSCLVRCVSRASLAVGAAVGFGARIRHLGGTNHPWSKPWRSGETRPAHWCGASARSCM